MNSTLFGLVLRFAESNPSYAVESTHYGSLFAWNYGVFEGGELSTEEIFHLPAGDEVAWREPITLTQVDIIKTTLFEPTSLADSSKFGHPIDCSYRNIIVSEDDQYKTIIKPKETIYYDFKPDKKHYLSILSAPTFSIEQPLLMYKPELAIFRSIMGQKPIGIKTYPFFKRGICRTLYSPDFTLSCVFPSSYTVDSYYSHGFLQHNPSIPVDLDPYEYSFDIIFSIKTSLEPFYFKGCDINIVVDKE